MCTSHRALVDRCVECGRVPDRSLSSDRARSAHERSVAEIAALPAGVERLVRALHYLAGVSAGRIPSAGPLRFEPVLVELYPELAHACPDFWPGGANTVDLLAPPWSSLAVAAWFLGRVAETGRPPNASLQGWVTTGNWWHGRHSELAPPLAAWRFQEGSLTHLSDAKQGVSADRRCDAFVVAADGRVMRSYNEPCALSARALVAMGLMLWGQPRRPWD
jgi:hypothetical protein